MCHFKCGIDSTYEFIRRLYGRRNVEHCRRDKSLLPCVNCDRTCLDSNLARIRRFTGILCAQLRMFCAINLTISPTPAEVWCASNIYRSLSFCSQCRHASSSSSIVMIIRTIRSASANTLQAFRNYMYVCQVDNWTYRVD